LVKNEKNRSESLIFAATIGPPVVCKDWKPVHGCSEPVPIPAYRLSMPSTHVPSRSDSTLEALFIEQRQRACRYARWMLGNASDAEEAVQEAFLRLARRPADDPRGNGQPEACRFTGLLFTTVRNLCIDMLRKQGRQKRIPLTEANEPPAAKHDDRQLQRLDRDLGQLINELPDHYAEALKLKVTGDLTYEQIAAVLGCSRPQVRTWIFRARRQLARELARLGWLEDVK
jgi:RNA polymerase sigma-70 factor (ECF subfamily)